VKLPRISARPFLGLASTVTAILLAIAAGPRAETQPIDLEQSSVTLHVNKSGLFSAFADNHIIKARIANGTISEDAPFDISLSIRSADLRVLDPNLSPDRRAEVQARMLGSEVLDASRFPEITFASTTIAPSGPDRWKGDRPVDNPGSNANHHLPGQPYGRQVSRRRRHEAARVRFESIKVAGGTVKVKDEVKAEFEIAR
jgi:hypothetical protein